MCEQFYNHALNVRIYNF